MDGLHKKRFKKHFSETISSIENQEYTITEQFILHFHHGQEQCHGTEIDYLKNKILHILSDF